MSDLVERLRKWDTFWEDDLLVAADEIERLRAELAAAIKERDEARLEARFVDSRRPFIGGKLDGWMIDTDAAVYEADDEKYYRSRYMIVVGASQDGKAVNVVCEAVVYLKDPSGAPELTEAQRQGMKFEEIFRFEQEPEKEGGRA